MGIESTLDTPLAEAVRKAGSQSAYARLVGRSQTWVYNALAAGKPIEAEHAVVIERELGISRYRSRPDLYPREAAIAPPAPPSHDDDAAPLEPAR